MKGLPVIFFKTFIISVIVAIAVNSTYYTILTHGQTDYGQIEPLIIERTLFLNVIIAIMSAPMLFLVNMNYWNNPRGRLLLYFCGPILFMVALVYLGVGPKSKAADLLTGFVYLIMTSLFYFRLTHKNKQSDTTYREGK